VNERQDHAEQHDDAGRLSRRWRRWGVLAVAIALGCTVVVAIAVASSGHGTGRRAAGRHSTTSSAPVKVGGERTPTTPPTTLPPTTAAPPPPPPTTVPTPPPTPPWTAPSIAPPPGVEVAETPGACRWESTNGGTFFHAGVITSSLADDTTWLVTANWNDDVNGFLDTETEIVDLPPFGTSEWTIETPAPDPPQGGLTCSVEVA
jgi:hypothetical protein